MSEAQSPKYNFMVIDDSIEFSELIGNFLEHSFDSRVTIFENGMDGIEHAKENKIDFFFIDLEMEIDGIEVINSLTEIEQYKNSPIFVVSAHDNTDNRLDSICSGATSFVTKPLNFDEFSQQIQLVLDKWKTD